LINSGSSPQTYNPTLPASDDWVVLIASFKPVASLDQLLVNK
jgi:hypothetical protein